MVQPHLVRDTKGGSEKRTSGTFYPLRLRFALFFSRLTGESAALLGIPRARVLPTLSLPRLLRPCPMISFAHFPHFVINVASSTSLLVLGGRGDQVSPGRKPNPQVSLQSRRNASQQSRLLIHWTAARQASHASARPTNCQD